MTYVVEAACVMAALVFGASAAAKLRSRSAYLRFRAAMAGLLPRPLTGGLAVTELAVALGLGAAAAFPGGRDLVALIALGAAALLTGLLIAGVSVIIRRGVRAQCACFGSSEPIGMTHLVRNLTLLGLVLAGLLAGVRGGQAGAPAAVVMAVVAGACLALFIIRWEDLAVLVVPSRGAD